MLPLAVPKATALLNFSFKCLNAVSMEEAQGRQPHFIKLEASTKNGYCVFKKYISNIV